MEPKTDNLLEAGSSTKRNILILEDNPAFREMISDVSQSLAGDGAVIVFERGQDVLSLLQKGELFDLDLALIDLGLPDMSGVDVIAALHRRFVDLPIMVVSVISSEAALLGAIRAGARGYISKSDSEAAIEFSIKDVLSGNYPISPSLARALFKLAGAPSVGVDDPFGLTRRELETLKLLAGGRSYEEVADAMGISLSTIQSHIRKAYRKLDVRTQMQAVVKARDAGII